jgi:hypothetical protein
MKPLSIRNRGISLLGLLAIVAVVAVGGFAIYKYLIPWWWPKRTVSTLVRGYLAVSLGRSELGNFNQSRPPTKEGKHIYLPGVTVFLEDPQNAKTSNTVRTDLSGRFSLHAAAAGRYRICWKSPVYGDGCTPVFVSTGSAPQFVSTVHITLPAKEGQVAVMGEVTMADGSLARTFDPFLNINAFATVGLDDEKGSRIADVYVNNFGEYLLPYVPTKQKIKLTASTESARFTQEIWPEAEIQTARLNQVNLRFENNRPRLDPLVAFDSVNKRRVQNALPGSKVSVQANARDKDGDEIQYAWFVDPSDGALSQTIGPAPEWQLPSGAGLHSVTVVAFDDKGGYDKAVLSVLAGDKGTPFTGVIVEPSGAPVANASVEIVGNPAVNTDANGRFRINVKEDARYVFNVRKEGYALNSRIYDRSVTGGRWILRRGQVVTIDPTRDVNIGDRRNERDCTGPDSVRAKLGPAGDSLTIPQWQDGEGNIIDPPPWYDGPRSVADLMKKKDRPKPPERPEGQQVVLPRDLKLPPCGPGVSVEIPANSILDANGNLATAPINVTIATVDLLSPQQMPGDDSVAPIGGGGSNSLKSFGAGSLDLPSGFKLKPGASARVTIPVDRAQLVGGNPPATVPLLSYDEQKGVWVEEDTLTLVTIGGLKMYQGSVKHFTTFNADVLFTNNACLRVFSPGLPGQYDLEVTAPYPDGTLHIAKYTIDNVSSTEHVIYNLVPNTNITLVPMTTGPNSQLLGLYIVNSGPITPFVGNPGAGNSPPGPPYTDCKNFVVLKVNSAPDSPFGGEFLHGLGFISAVNLGFDDLTAAGPTGNALRDAIVTASKNYYATLDTSPGGALDTFDKFKLKYGFGPLGAPAPGEIVASYANSGDLGFGRDMHCMNKNGDIACYVTNYGKGYDNIFEDNAPGGGTADQDDADAAAARATVGLSADLATVAMEYSPVTVSGPRVVKFFVYKNLVINGQAYGRSISANLDGRGERPVPQLCMICHGGRIPQQPGGVPVFGTAADVDFNSRFLPFDHRFFTFPTALPKATQEAAIKSLNTTIVDLVPTGAPSTDPIREVVNGLYNNGVSATQILNFTVPQWVTGASANAPNQANFYEKVLANDCRGCHIAQPYPQLQFRTSDQFVNLSVFPVSTVGGASNHLMLGTAQLRVCGDYVMPHALRTHDIFWDIYWDVPNWGPPPAPASVAFQTFGDGIPAGATNTWKPNLCTDFISGTVSSPSQFYQHTIQPIWNAKCVACHIAGGPASFRPLTEGLSYNELVPAMVVPGNDADTAGELLRRITGVGPEALMPQNCVAAPALPGPGQLPCLTQSDIAKIKAWIRNGAQ